MFSASRDFVFTFVPEVGSPTVLVSMSGLGVLDTLDPLVACEADAVSKASYKGRHLLAFDGAGGWTRWQRSGGVRFLAVGSWVWEGVHFGGRENEGGAEEPLCDFLE